MQTPTTDPERQVPPPPVATRRQRREEDLIVIPEARQPGRWRLVGALAAAGLAAVLAVALAVAYTGERRRADDLEAELATALDDQATLTGEAAAARDRLLLLEGRVIDLEERLRLAHQGRSVLAASRREARRELVRSRDALEAERARFQSFMGSVVADGTHVGKLVAVGANQDPARLITDLGRWFTGRAATQAAIVDNAIRAGDTVSRYFRNELSTWRTLPVDPSATVTLRRWNGRGTYTVSLEELQRLSNALSRRAGDVFRSPFSMTLSGGQVTSLRELAYP